MILEKIKIRDQMAIIGVKRTAFVIDTNKGILIVPVDIAAMLREIVADITPSSHKRRA